MTFLGPEGHRICHKKIKDLQLKLGNKIENLENIIDKYRTLRAGINAEPNRDTACPIEIAQWEHEFQWALQQVNEVDP